MMLCILCMLVVLLGLLSHVFTKENDLVLKFWDVGHKV